jgi:hypothetical protein
VPFLGNVSMKQPSDPNAKVMRRDSRVRIIDETTSDNDRRSFLRTFAAYGVALPAAHLFSGDRSAVSAREDTSALATAEDASNRYGSSATSRPRDSELVRLLREAAEIEHSLMLQYLYGGLFTETEVPDVDWNRCPECQRPPWRRHSGDAAPHGRQSLARGVGRQSCLYSTGLSRMSLISIPFN